MNDPLNIEVPLEGLETGLPILPEGDYVVQCTESKAVKNKREDGYNWNLKLCTTETTTAVDQREVKPDFPVFFTCALQPTPDSTDPDAFRRNLGQVVDALFGTTKENRPNFNGEMFAQVIGKKCIAHCKPDTYEGNVKTKVTRLKALPAS
jgi:hypothetical protein